MYVSDVLFCTVADIVAADCVRVVYDCDKLCEIICAVVAGDTVA